MSSLAVTVDDEWPAAPIMDVKQLTRRLSSLKGAMSLSVDDDRPEEPTDRHSDGDAYPIRVTMTRPGGHRSTVIDRAEERTAAKAMADDARQGWRLAVITGKPAELPPPIDDSPAPPMEAEQPRSLASAKDGVMFLSVDDELPADEPQKPVSPERVARRRSGTNMPDESEPECAAPPVQSDTNHPLAASPPVTVDTARDSQSEIECYSATVPPSTVPTIVHKLHLIKGFASLDIEPRSWSSTGSPSSVKTVKVTVAVDAAQVMFSSMDSMLPTTSVDPKVSSPDTGEYAGLLWSQDGKAAFNAEKDLQSRMDECDRIEQAHRPNAVEGPRKRALRKHSSVDW